MSRRPRSRVSNFALVSLACLTVAACGRHQTPAAGGPEQDALDLLGSGAFKTADFNAALDSVSEQRVKDQLYTLAGPDFQGRGSGQEGGRKAREWIAARFAEIGLTPGNAGSYFQEFNSTREAGKTANVLGYFPGNDPALKDQVIVIGGHHDHLGVNSSGSVYWGADDNASGTDAVIEIARALAPLRGDLRRTVLFATFDAEERGLVGSYAYTAQPSFPMAKTVYMLNMDMIGYLKAKRNMQCLGCKSSVYAASLLENIMRKYPSMGTPYMSSSASGGSDHYPFGKKGVPYGFFHTGTDVSPYHKPTDTPDKLDYAGVTDAVKVGLEMTWALAIGDQSPRASAVATSVTDEEGFDHGVSPFVK